jgi:hypothetical protein
VRQDLESTQKNSESISLENSKLWLVVPSNLTGRIPQLYDKTTELDTLTSSFQDRPDEETPVLLKHYAEIGIEPGDGISLPDYSIDSRVLDSDKALSHVPNFKIEIQALGKPVPRFQGRIQHSLILGTWIGLLVCSDEGGVISLHEVGDTQVRSAGDVVPPP